MTKIKTELGAAIAAAVAGTLYAAVPMPANAHGSFGEAFLASLTANESDGDITSTRFEARVLGQLTKVAAGQVTNMGAITAAKLLNFRPPSPDAQYSLEIFCADLLAFATSYGPTQIMGYQALAGGYSLLELKDPAKHYPHAITMLEDFRKRFDFRVEAGSAGFFFHCWNAGSPSAPTFDPQYTARGLERMAIYGAL